MRRIVYDGDSVYELDEECLKKKEERKKEKEKNAAGEAKSSIFLNRK